MKLTDQVIKDLNKKINAAMKIISKYGNIDGGHHKQWVLDQVARKLLGKVEYKKWAEGKPGYDDWDTGIAP